MACEEAPPLSSPQQVVDISAQRPGAGTLSVERQAHPSPDSCITAIPATNRTRATPMPQTWSR